MLFVDSQSFDAQSLTMSSCEVHHGSLSEKLQLDERKRVIRSSDGVNHGHIPN